MLLVFIYYFPHNLCWLLFEKTNEVKMSETTRTKRTYRIKQYKFKFIHINNTSNEIFENITSVLILFVKYSSVCVSERERDRERERLTLILQNKD